MEEFIKATIIEAGDTLHEMFGKVGVIYTKDTISDEVTEADLASNKIITDAIKKQFPTHGIVSEEGDDYKKESEWQWFVDPLDGTRNFASNVPLFGINIAVAYNNEIKFGAIYLPFTKEFCFAEKGKGAFLNGKKILCSERKEWQGSYGIASIKPYSERYYNFLRKMSKASNNTAWINAIGCPAATGIYIADGRRDWFITMGNSNPWDHAASSIIVREAGGVASDIDGNEWKSGATGFVIANKYLYPELIKMIRESSK